MSAILAAPHAALTQWLRLLWDRAPPLRFEGASPYIAHGEIHLPAHDEWRHHAAAAAHATAHLVYSPAAFDGTGLGPTARALVALLEDARVEALAMRELPGLARLWRPWHVATPQTGADFESLMQRLARALIDPGYADPDPWVAKGRRLFFIDAGLGLLALRTPAEVRRAATLLGHDIGQKRLPFNAKTAVPAPAYRDDHRWMWAAERPPREASPRAEPSTGADATGDDEAPGTTTLHPEWDRLIARLRPDWTRVTETPAPSASAPAADDDELRAATRRLHAPLQRWRDRAPATRLDEDGEVFEPAALVDLRLARRLRRAPDPRVYRRAVHGRADAAVWLLVDQSASAAACDAATGHALLRAATRAAAAVAGALHGLGVPCAVAGFASNGRHAVRLRVVKRFDDAADGAMRAGLARLRPGGSTRLGAALRHAAGALARRGTAHGWVLLLSDGEPHDIDVHDPRYLVEDARHAVREALRRGVRTACLVLGDCGDTDSRGDVRRIFGSRGAICLGQLRSLPAALSELLG
jgi:nitric oxide reductase activation protein